ncbi:hypothetical protein GCM10023258_19550 [Terrabacter aeriphilus]|uniref:Uncharacterized protein n=1 Tax=Terrabacter aeriphilus TaxID=515662 RepID=A0ABP9JB18_9MICO
MTVPRANSTEGLSVGYRIGYRLRMIGLTVFGPAQLGEGNDPKARLERERAARVARARAARTAPED